MDTFRDAHALVIGVGGSLPVTVDDAQAVARLLTDPDRCAVPATNVRLLTEWDATRDGIVRGLTELADDAAPDDVVTVYFSGHGERQDGSGKRRFLVPRDDHRLLDGEEFTALLRRIKSRRLLVLLDCCYAAGVHAESTAKARGHEIAPLPFSIDELRRRGAGTVVICSSRDDEVSWTARPLSVFTLAVLEALCGFGAKRPDGYVRVPDIAMYVAQWVPSRTDDQQHPDLHLEEADNYPVAYYAAGGRKAIPAPKWLSGVPDAHLANERADAGVSPPTVEAALNTLRALLVANVLDEAEAKRIARESGFGSGAAWWARDPESFWDDVLRRAHTAWRMEAVFVAADNVFGLNPYWRASKMDYLAARDSPKTSGGLHVVPDVAAYPDGTQSSLLERRVNALATHLHGIVPSALDDPRARGVRLRQILADLDALTPVMSALTKCAAQEHRELQRYELHQLIDQLEQRREFVIDRVTELRSATSRPKTRQLCEELRSATPPLLDQYSRAIVYIT